MVKYKDKIIAYFDGCPDGVVVAANELYEKEFSKMSEAAFFKALERLAKSGIIQRVAKGMYMKSASSKGDDVLNHFFGENNDNGVYIGTRLYNKYGISDVRSDEIWLYSNSIKNETCNIDNIHVKKADIELDYENARVIEALEILQNYYKIENIDKYKFARFAKKYPLAAIALVVIAVAVLLFQRMSDNNPTVSVPMDGLYVHYIDVGQGDSELLCCNGQYMLIDAGVPSAGDTVVEYIRDLGIKKLDYVVCTHGHADHCGGYRKL